MARDIEEILAEDVIFFDTGSQEVLRSTVPAMMRRCIFVDEHVSNDHENIFYDECVFINCTGLPPKSKTFKCRYVDRIKIP